MQMKNHILVCFFFFKYKIESVINLIDDRRLIQYLSFLLYTKKSDIHSFNW